MREQNEKLMEQNEQYKQVPGSCSSALMAPALMIIMGSFKSFTIDFVEIIFVLCLSYIEIFIALFGEQ